MTAKRQSASLSRLLERYFVQHLRGERNASACTVESYNYTFRLLVKYSMEVLGQDARTLRVEDWSAPVLLGFLHHLETKRGSCARTRNQRLSALKSFFKYVGAREPSMLAQAEQVRAIPQKRFDERLIEYLTREELEAVLVAANKPGWFGQRDHAMILTTYYTGGRVSEITNATRGDADLAGRNGLLRIHGKGRKERVAVLPATATRVLREWQARLGPRVTALFPGRTGLAITRSGAAERLSRAVARASETLPSLRGRKISPHVLRHTIAMHMLDAGVSLPAISLFLGHESLQTTHKYLAACIEMKRKTLEVLPALGPWRRRSTAKDEDLIGLLENLQRSSRSSVWGIDGTSRNPLPLAPEIPPT